MKRSLVRLSLLARRGRGKNGRRLQKHNVCALFMRIEKC